MNVHMSIKFDREYKILAINLKYGGAANDSFVWKHSFIREMLEKLYKCNILRNAWHSVRSAINLETNVYLGDLGYPLEPWCITP